MVIFLVRHLLGKWTSPLGEQMIKTITEQRPELTIIFKDSYEKTRTHSLRFPVGTSLTQITVFAEGYISRLRTYFTCGIPRYNIVLPSKYISDKAIPGSNPLEGVTIVVEKLNNQPGRLIIPGINPALIETAGPYAGIALQQPYPASLAALIALLPSLSDSDGELFTTNILGSSLTNLDLSYVGATSNF